MEEKKKGREQRLFEFAYIPGYDEKLRYLAEELADREQWDFADSGVKKYAILRNYLEHMFRKVQHDGLISYTRNNAYACFDTGLATRYFEPIYAFFERNNNLDRQGYVLKSFCKHSDSNFRNHFAGNTPDRANFFANPEQLIFNPHHGIVADVEHIIDDNIDRFPSEYKEKDRDVVRTTLEGALIVIRQRVAHNYKLAVPQYYNHRIQLLLPLCLSLNLSTPDLALVVYKETPTSNEYIARTCLTLKMAYNNARLIVKPQSDWLRP